MMNRPGIFRNRQDHCIRPGQNILYDKDKPKAGIKIELANHDSMILEITEDWDNEDLYAAIQERSNESSWELQGGLQLQPIECNHTKIFKAGYGGMPIIQVRR